MISLEVSVPCTTQQSTSMMLREENHLKLCIKNTTIKRTSLKHADTKRDWIILVMGPTGAGKSRFIEALSGNDSLRISKDQLASYTQTVESYQLVDTVMWEGVGTKASKIKPDVLHMYVVDTPGFCDGQISELEIIQMVHEWLRVNKRTAITFLLYLCPITDTRLSGSKRRTIEMVKNLTRIGTATCGSVLVATTMWDKIWNERGRLAAEKRFIQLRDDVWKDLNLRSANGATVKFFNTHESAIDLINTMTALTERRRSPMSSLFSAYDLDHAGPLQNASFAGHLYQDLLERILSGELYTQSLEAELDGPMAKKSAELKSILESQLVATDRILEKFETQLIDFGDPPKGFEAAAKLRLSLMEKHYKRSAPSVAPLSNEPHRSQPAQHRVSALKRVLDKGLQAIWTKTVDRPDR